MNGYEEFDANVNQKLVESYLANIDSTLKECTPLCKVLKISGITTLMIDNTKLPREQRNEIKTILYKNIRQKLAGIYLLKPDNKNGALDNDNIQELVKRYLLYHTNPTHATTELVLHFSGHKIFNKHVLLMAGFKPNEEYIRRRVQRQPNGLVFVLHYDSNTKVWELKISFNENGALLSLPMPKKLAKLLQGQSYGNITSKKKEEIKRQITQHKSAFLFNAREKDPNFSTTILERAEWVGDALKAAGIEALDLRQKNLYQLSSNQWSACCKLIEISGITTLYLNDNNLSKFEPDEWFTFCGALQRSCITTLDLSHNNLSALLHNQLGAFCEVIKNSGITTLILRGNDLHSLKGKDRVAFCDAIEQAGVTTLDAPKLMKDAKISLILEKNISQKLAEKYIQRHKNQVQAVTNLIFFILGCPLPKEASDDPNFSLLSLRLEYGQFDKATCIGQAIKNAGITELNLSHKNLHLLNAKHWGNLSDLFIGAGIIKVNLSNNFLSSAEIKRVDFDAFCRNRSVPLYNLSSDNLWQWWHIHPFSA